MCLSKGLTGGYLPLSAVLTGNRIYQAFYDDYQNLTGFLHSHSYTGNALGCRAALATIGIFQTEDVLQRNLRLAAAMAKALERFRDHPNVGEIRQTGMIAAIELVKDKQTREAIPGNSGVDCGFTAMHWRMAYCCGRSGT